MADKTKKGFKLLHWVGFVLLFLVFVFVLATLSANRHLSEAQTKLEESGRPLTFEENIPEAVPDEKNAAIELAAAAAQLQDEAFGESDLLSELSDAARKLLQDPADADALEKFGRLYDSGAVAEALALVKEGILKGEYHNDLDFSQGIMLELPHVVQLTGLSKILAATVRLQAADGDQAGAWDTALTSLRLANVLENEPILVSQLVRAANISQAIDSIRSLDPAAAPPSHLAEIDALLTRIEDPAPFVAAIDTERLVGEQFFRTGGTDLIQWAQSSHEGPGQGILMGAYHLLPPLRQRDRAEHSNALREMADILAQPYSPGDDQRAKNVHAGIPPYSFVAKMVVPGMGQIKPRMTGIFAEAGITRAGLAVQAYHQEHGSYPPDLATLGRSDLLDPFNGQPLHYNTDGHGFTISSVGPNQNADSSELNWSHPGPGQDSP